MTDEQKVAYVHAQAVAATAEIEAMKIANYMSVEKGQPVPNSFGEFMRVIEKYGLHHNALISLFQGS